MDLRFLYDQLYDALRFRREELNSKAQFQKIDGESFLVELWALLAQIAS